MVREAFKDIDLSGRRWRIKKFSALVGSYICLKLMSKISYIILGVMSKEVSDPQVIMRALTQEIGSLSKTELFDIQKECLGACEELRLVGAVEAPMLVLLPDGRFGVEGVEDDILLALALTVHSIMFNMAPFFDESALKGVFDSFPDFSLQKPST